LPFLRFTQQLKGEPVPQELLDRLCELIAVLAGGAAAKYEALKEDVIGELSTIRRTFNTMANTGKSYNGNSTYRKVLCIVDSIVVVIFFYLGLALTFHRKLESYESEPNVVLATSIISKTVHPKIDKIGRKGLCKTLGCKKLSQERCTEPDASTEIDGSNNILELARAAIPRTTNTVTKKETTVLRRSFATKREEDDGERVEIQPNDDFRASLL
ncbi:unnamed protein product, partial [Brassica rapa subsp. narinosa]